MPTLDETIAFITRAHAGQFDQSGEPYYLYPVAVMQRLPAGVPDHVRHAALLHDIVEDTPYTPADLAAMGYDAETLEIVALLTIDPADTSSYDEKIDAIIASGNAGAIEVKFADMSENGAPARLVKLTEERRNYLIDKYRGPLQRLAAARRAW